MINIHNVTSSSWEQGNYQQYLLVQAGYPRHPPSCMLHCCHRTLQFAHSVADVIRMGDAPKVVLATGAGMDYGMARQLLLHWGSNPHNAVIFTQKPRVSARDSQAKCLYKMSLAVDVDTRRMLCPGAWLKPVSLNSLFSHLHPAACDKGGMKLQCSVIHNAALTAPLLTSPCCSLARLLRTCWPWAPKLACLAHAASP